MLFSFVFLEAGEPIDGALRLAFDSDFNLDLNLQLTRGIEKSDLANTIACDSDSLA